MHPTRIAWDLTPSSRIALPSCYSKFTCQDSRVGQNHISYAHTVHDLRTPFIMRSSRTQKQETQSWPALSEHWWTLCWNELHLITSSCGWSPPIDADTGGLKGSNLPTMRRSVCLHEWDRSSVWLLRCWLVLTTTKSNLPTMRRRVCLQEWDRVSVWLVQCLLKLTTTKSII